MHSISSTTRGRTAILIAALGLLLAAVGTTAAVIAGPASSAQSSEPAELRDPHPAPDAHDLAAGSEPPAIAGGGLTENDGLLPAGATVFDDGSPGISGLRAELREALRAAATDAGSQGIEFVVNSGWRSAEYQRQLLREAVSDYGSIEEASRWVATPQTSAHVSGDAVDIDGGGASDWLWSFGAAYGLCQTYANEPWHYELIPEAAANGCPRMYADPTEDPRMRG